MKKWNRTWIALRSNLWFVPVVLVAVAIAAAIGLIWLDIRYQESLNRHWPKVFDISPDAARDILSAIATSIITVAGVVFSIVIVALSVAANQYTPRILRTFMRDRRTQWVLGVFVAVFTYSLLVLRMVRAGDNPFVPSLALSGAMLLALISVGFLVYFIHHIASSIQAPTMISTICNDTIQAVEDLFPIRPIPEPTGQEDATAEAGCGKWVRINAQQTGYLQSVGSGLADLACKHNVRVRVEVRVGEFIVRETPVLSVCSHEALSQKLANQMLRCLAIDTYRTVEQDPGYGVRQLVDIALKALSPGVNDTSTAVNCIDYIGAILHTAVQRGAMPRHIVRDGQVRVLFRRCLTVDRLIDQALLQIRQSAKGNPAVILRMLNIIGEARAVARQEYHGKLSAHVDLLEELASKTVPFESDREAVMNRIRAYRER